MEAGCGRCRDFVQTGAACVPTGSPALDLDFAVRTGIQWAPRRMAHPKDRSGLTRRQLLKGAAGRRSASGARAARRLREHDDADRRRWDGGRSNLVVPKPLGPGGLPLPRPDNAVTWAITTDNEPIPDGAQARERAARDLQLRRLHRPGLVKKFEKLYGRKVQIATYNSSDEAIAKLASGAVVVRRDHRPLRLEHRQPDRAAAAPAAQPLVPVEPREEHLAGAAGPVLRPRQPLHRAVRRLVGRDRLAQRQDRRRHRRDGRAVGHLLGVAALQGKVAILDDKRDALAMPMQRDAMRTGAPPRPQHRGPGDRRQGRRGPRAS